MSERGLLWDRADGDGGAVTTENVAVLFTDMVGSTALFFAARTNLSWGRMLAERGAPGDAKKARELLDKAHTTAEARGYSNVERRAAQALQDLT